MASTVIASDTLQMQLQSARKSILFLETQHADTLKALHAELRSLKTKCSKLSFQLAMQGSTQSDVDQSNSKQDMTDLQRTVDQQNADIANLTMEKVRLLQQIEERDRQIVALEEEQKNNEIKCVKNYKMQNHKITSLVNEAESRATTIVYLQSELAKARRKIASMMSQESSPTTLFSEAMLARPTPPPYPRRPISASSSISNQSESSMIDESQPISSQKLFRRGLKSVKVTGAVTPQPMPDPTVFFQAHVNYQRPPNDQPIRDQRPFHEPRPPSVLPPIRRSSLVSSENSSEHGDILHGVHNGNNNPDIMMQTKRYSAKQKRFSTMNMSTSNSTQEIAISPMASRMSPERKVQEG